MNNDILGSDVFKALLCAPIFFLFFLGQKLNDFCFHVPNFRMKWRRRSYHAYSRI